MIKNNHYFKQYTMEEILKRKVKGIWVPIEVWEDTNLNWNEKILFLEIDSYTTKDKDCYVSNEYIAKLLHVNETTANKILSSLISKGYVVKTSFDGRKRYVKSALSISTRQGCDKSQGRLADNHNIPNIDNNIYTNNKESTYVDKKKTKNEEEITNEDYRKFRIWMGTNCPYCNNPRNMPSSTITQSEFLKLKSEYSGRDIAETILEIENRKDLRKKYANLYRTTLNWLKNRNK